MYPVKPFMEKPFPQILRYYKQKEFNMILIEIKRE